jgi:hypothetical protein
MARFRLLLIAAAAAETAALAAGTVCPPGTDHVDSFTTADGMPWLVCDLASPGGGITLVPQEGEVVHMPKSYEPYSPEPDDAYYLGLGKETVLNAKWDMLGDAILNSCASKTPTTGLCEPTWARVERAVPVIRYSRGKKAASGNNFMCSPYAEESGVRTFTGSRSASVGSRHDGRSNSAPASPDHQSGSPRMRSHDW